ncbi:MAG: hypothetical protein KME18_18260 [Phormidium tanganyikae FI6-MK23]|jgi:hypothetical protein|nr:hypothetical protein [Phormidium tanganyikae FI6-MK23]
MFSAIAYGVTGVSFSYCRKIEQEKKNTQNSRKLKKIEILRRVALKTDSGDSVAMAENRLETDAQSSTTNSELTPNWVKTGSEAKPGLLLPLLQNIQL